MSLNVTMRLALQSAVLVARDQLFSLRARRDGFSTEGTLPKAMVVGAQRCGTTSLAAWIAATGRYQLGVRKETHFFDRHFELGLDWYRSQFPTGSTLDATPAYMVTPEARRRLSQTMSPETKLVVVLRDPADRARSHYQYQRQRRLEWRPFAAALEDERDEFASLPTVLRGSAERHFNYVRTGCYGTQLQDLTSLMPASPLHICDFHRLYGGDGAELAALAEFLEITTADRAAPLRKLNHSTKTAIATSPAWAEATWTEQQSLVASIAGRPMSWH